MQRPYNPCIYNCRIAALPNYPTIPYQTQRIASLHPPYPPPELSNCQINYMGHLRRTKRPLHATAPQSLHFQLSHCRITELPYHTRHNALRLYTHPILHLNCRIGKLITWDICAKRNGRCMQRPYNPCIYNCRIAALSNWHIVELSYQTQRIASLHPPYPPPELSHCRIAELAHWHINYYLAT